MSDLVGHALKAEDQSGYGVMRRESTLCVPANNVVPAKNALPLAATVAELRELQQQRRYCIKSQSRCDRSTDSYIARFLGYRNDLPEDERKALYKRAATLRRTVEKQIDTIKLVYERRGASRLELGLAMASYIADAPPYAALVSTSADSRVPWDAYRRRVEKRMRTAAKSLPVWPFVEAIAGFGELGLAIIVGETGDLSNYATREQLWKRLGLAVIGGERQQRKTGDEGIVQGYAPERRAEMWTLGDSMFRAQWAATKDDAPAGPKGPYGEVYARRKSATETRGWDKAQRDNDARRIMFKVLLRDLHRAWRGAIPQVSLSADSKMALLPATTIYQADQCPPPG